MSGEIEWSEAPNPELTRDKHQIVRCGTGSMSPQIILNNEIVGADLHWFQGRSTPHLRKDCPFCGPGKQTVWKGHVCGMDEKTKRIAIVEFTAPCVDPLNVYKLTFGSLRGARLKIHRLGGKANGKLVAIVEQGNYGTNELPLPFDIRAALQFMWNARRDLHNIRLETPRVVTDGPTDNDDLKRKRPDRAAAVEQSRIDADNESSAARSIKRNGHKNHASVISDVIGHDDSAEKTMTLQEGGRLFEDVITKLRQPKVGGDQ